MPKGRLYHCVIPNRLLPGAAFVCIFHSVAQQQRQKLQHQSPHSNSIMGPTGLHFLCYTQNNACHLRILPKLGMKRSLSRKQNPPQIQHSCIHIRKKRRFYHNPAILALLIAQIHSGMEFIGVDYNHIPRLRHHCFCADEQGSCSLVEVFYLDGLVKRTARGFHPVDS